MAVFFGVIYDHKWLNICTKVDSFVVNESKTLFEAHILEFGAIHLQSCKLVAPFSIHPLSVLSGQHIVDEGITIAASTRVLFTKNISKIHSGVYTGCPGIECREKDLSDSTSTFVQKEQIV